MNRQGPQATVLIAAGILAGLMLLNLVGLLKPIQGLVGLVLEPVTSTLQIGSQGKLARENEELQKKVNELTAEVARREEAARINDALRSQLNFAQSNNYKLTEASIISQDPTNYKQFLTIDRGSSSGIQKGMVAVTQGLLVGRVTETTPSTAKVYLITDYNSAVPVIDQQTRASGLVRGERGFGLVLEMVPQTEQLKSGDSIITSGFGGDYPKGLVVGTIGDVNQRPSDVYQSAEIRPAVDFRKLESVFIITGNQ